MTATSFNMRGNLKWTRKLYADGEHIEQCIYNFSGLQNFQENNWSSIASNSSGCLIVKRSDIKSMKSFESWCYCSMSRINWTERKTGKWVINWMNCEGRLMAMINRRNFLLSHVCLKVSLHTWWKVKLTVTKKGLTKYLLQLQHIIQL